ncbi:MAG: sulfite exporter TauE/SafE family protein [Sutterella sp.]|nr:sulfite exporter TauE/SafE family protein [Sutterella sp.]
MGGFEWFEFVELFGLGIGVGAFGAMVGIGGGLIMVPLFMLTMMTPNGSTFNNVQEVIGTSLFGVLLNAMSGTWAYIRQQKVIFRAAIPFALATVPGAFFGSYITDYFTGRSFSLVFGTALCLLAILMYSKSKGKKATVEVKDYTFDTSGNKILLGVALSFFVGFLSSILGIGGGVIHVPMLVFALGFPPHIAVATSTFVLMVSAAVGVVGHAMLAHIVWVPALAVGFGAIVGAQIGAMLSKKSRPRLIIVILSCVMFVLGLQFVVRAL